MALVEINPTLGTNIASAIWATYNPEYAFDRNLGTRFRQRYASTGWVGKDYTGEIIDRYIIKKVKIVNYGGSGFKNTQIIGWNGSSWIAIPIESATNATYVNSTTYELPNDGSTSELILTNSTEYTKYAVQYTSKWHTSDANIYEAYFYEEDATNNITLGTLYQESKTDEGLTLKLPFSDDDNEDCIVNAYYKESADEDYILVDEMTRETENFTINITGLEPGKTYDFKAKADDNDGITGEATQYILNQTLTYNRVRIENLVITEAYNSKTITADVIGDEDNNSEWQYSYRRSAVGNFEAGAWSEYIPLTVDEGKINFTITGLIKSTGYDIEIDITDDGGVDNGTTY